MEYSKEPKDIKKIIKIVTPIVLGVLVIGLFVFYCFVYNTPSGKLKRVLEDNNFKCKNGYCRKNVDDYSYEINYKTAEAVIQNNKISFTIGLNNSRLDIKEKHYICNFTSPYYTPVRSIDETYNVDDKCTPYIEELNEIINHYESYLDEAKVNIQKFLEQ